MKTKHHFHVTITVDPEIRRQHVEMYVRDALTKYRDDPILNLDRRHVRVSRAYRAAERAAARICADYGMDGDSPEDNQRTLDAVTATILGG